MARKDAILSMRQILIMRRDALRTALAAAQKSLPAAQALDKELSEIQDGTNAMPGFGAVNRDVARFVTMIQSGDIRPPKSIIENATPSCLALKNDLARWRKVNTETLPALNQILKQQQKLAELAIAAVDMDPMCPK